MITPLQPLFGQMSVTSVMDGDWEDPSTWDCSCVPGNSAHVQVDHYVFINGILSKGSGSLTIGPTGAIDAFDPVFLGCEVTNYGYMSLWGLYITWDPLPFENLGILDCWQLVNEREGFYNAFSLMVVDTLFNHASLINGPGGYVDGYAIVGAGLFENFNVASFFGHAEPDTWFINHDTLDIHGSTGSGSRSILNEGHLSLHDMTIDTLLNMGSINSWTTTLAAYYEGEGYWYFQPFGQDLFIGSAATMIVDAPGWINVSNGDLVVEGILDGNGCVRVYGLTENQGTITGTIDLCDLSPTTTVPPILDVNAGTVTAGVTFCAGTGCITEIAERDPLSSIMIMPVPVNDRCEVRGIPPGHVNVKVLGVDGTPILSASGPADDRMILDLPNLAAGVYLVRVRTDLGERSIPIVVEQ